MKIGLLHTTIRGDEKLILEAAKERNIQIETIDVRTQIFHPNHFPLNFDVGLERCISTVVGSHVVRFLESQNIPTVNPSSVAELCENKFITSLQLQKNNVPTPSFALAFTEKQAKKAIEELGGYPVVIKSTSGSWGRLIAKLNDDDALEAIIEHKQMLGSPNHKAIYLQKYIPKPERDIRVTVIGDKPICAIYRQTSHWITNTARGAEAIPLKMDDDLKKISQKAAKAVGGGIVGIDVFETKDGYVVNEVNHTTEFKNVQNVTKVDVAGAMIEYCQSQEKQS